YSVGMDVPGGATIHAVLSDRVLLRRAGRLETLRLEKELPTSPDAVVSVPPARGLPAGTEILGAEAAMKLSSIRAELLTDPTKASQYMRMQPARRDGALVGYRIYPGRDRQLFREMGLRPGDILTRVNGVDLNDPSRSLQLLGELSQASNIDITIERAGNQQSFSVSLNP
ncbi:MAG: type II secretion system protein GspC, partial [Oceanococcaceae bacterium]